jgi:hypothetical protein
MVISWVGGGWEGEIDLLADGGDDGDDDVVTVEFDLKVIDVPLFGVESFEWIGAVSNDLFIMFIITLR